MTETLALNSFLKQVDDLMESYTSQLNQFKELVNTTPEAAIYHCYNMFIVPQTFIQELSAIKKVNESGHFSLNLYKQELITRLTLVSIDTRESSPPLTNKAETLVIGQLLSMCNIYLNQ